MTVGLAVEEQGLGFSAGVCVPKLGFGFRGFGLRVFLQSKLETHDIFIVLEFRTT